MKIFHKPTLMNQRFIVYESEKQEEAKMTTYLEQVQGNFNKIYEFFIEFPINFIEFPMNFIEFY